MRELAQGLSARGRAGLEPGARGSRHTKPLLTASCPSARPPPASSITILPGWEAHGHLHFSPCLVSYLLLITKTRNPDKGPPPGPYHIRTRTTCLFHATHLFNNLHSSSAPPDQTSPALQPQTPGSSSSSSSATRPGPAPFHGPSPLSRILSAPSPGSGPCDSPPWKVFPSPPGSPSCCPSRFPLQT